MRLRDWGCRKVVRTYYSVESGDAKDDHNRQVHVPAKDTLKEQRTSIHLTL